MAIPPVPYKDPNAEARERLRQTPRPSPVAVPRRGMSEFEKGLERGTAMAKASLPGDVAVLSEAAQAVLPDVIEPEFLGDVQKWGLEKQEEILKGTQKPDLAPKVARIEDIDLFEEGGLGRLGDWAASTAGEQLPILGTMIGTGVAGRAAGALRAGKQVRRLASGAKTKQVDKQLKLKGLEGTERGKSLKAAALAEQGDAARKLQKAKNVGSLAGVGAGSFGIEAGLQFPELVREGVTPEDALLPTLTSSAIVAALDTAPWAVLGKYLGMDKLIPKKIGEVIKKDKKLSARAVELVKKASKGGAAGVTVEGLTEGVQELVNLAGERWAKDDPVLGKLSDEDRSQILNAAAAGALIGGGIGGVAGPFGGAGAQEGPPAPVPVKPPVPEAERPPVPDRGDLPRIEVEEQPVEEVEAAPPPEPPTEPRTPSEEAALQQLVQSLVRLNQEKGEVTIADIDQAFAGTPVENERAKNEAVDALFKMGIEIPYEGVEATLPQTELPRPRVQEEAVEEIEAAAPPKVPEDITDESVLDALKMTAQEQGGFLTYNDIVQGIPETEVSSEDIKVIVDSLKAEGIRIGETSPEPPGELEITWPEDITVDALPEKAPEKPKSFVQTLAESAVDVLTDLAGPSKTVLYPKVTEVVHAEGLPNSMVDEVISTLGDKGISVDMVGEPMGPDYVEEGPGTPVEVPGLPENIKIEQVGDEWRAVQYTDGQISNIWAHDSKDNLLGTLEELGVIQPQVEVEEVSPQAHAKDVLKRYKDEVAKIGEPYANETEAILDVLNKEFKVIAYTEGGKWNADTDTLGSQQEEDAVLYLLDELNELPAAEGGVPQIPTTPAKPIVEPVKTTAPPQKDGHIDLLVTQANNHADYSLEDVFKTMNSFADKYGAEELNKMLQEAPTPPVKQAPSLMTWFDIPHFEDQLKGDDPYQGVWAEHRNRDKSLGVIIINPKTDQVLLRRVKDKPGGGQYDGYAWNFASGSPPGGLVSTEHPLDTAKRETKEEMGFDTTVVGQLTTGFYTKKYSNRAHLFYVGVPKGKQDTGVFEGPQAETTETKWVSYKEALELLNKNANVKGSERIKRTLNALYGFGEQKNSLAYKGSPKGTEQYFKDPSRFSKDSAGTPIHNLAGKNWDALTSLQRVTVAVAFQYKWLYPNMPKHEWAKRVQAESQRRANNFVKWTESVTGKKFTLSSAPSGTGADYKKPVVAGEAKANVIKTGKPIVLRTYHGSAFNEGILQDSFSSEFAGEGVGGQDTKHGFFLSGNKDHADAFGNARLYEIYAAFKNPFVYDAKGASWHLTPTVQVIKDAKKNGHDGVVFLSLADSHGTSNQIVFWDSHNVKTSELENTEFSHGPIINKALTDSVPEKSLTRMEAEAAIEEEFGARWLKKATESGFLTLATEGAPSLTTGKADTETGQQTIYLENIGSTQELIGTMLHEGRHTTLDDILGSSIGGYYSDFLRAKGRKGSVAEAAYEQTAHAAIDAFGIDSPLSKGQLTGQEKLAEIERVRERAAAIEPTFLVQEDLAYYIDYAYMSESAQDRGLWRRIINAIKAWWATSAAGKRFERAGIRPELTDGMAVALGRVAVKNSLRVPKTPQQRKMYDAIVYHTTPHKWTAEKGFPQGRFRLDKVGKGEGYSSFGWGAYFSDAKEAGEAYIHSLGGQHGKKEMYLRKMDLPESVFSRILEWDRPLMEQHPAFMAALRNPKDGYLLLRMAYEAQNISTPYPAAGLPTKGTGGSLHEALARHFKKEMYGHKSPSKSEKLKYKKKVAEFLRDVGIVGAHYLDQKSRPYGKGTYMYTIWDQPTLDKMSNIYIQEYTYGQPGPVTPGLDPHTLAPPKTLGIEHDPTGFAYARIKKRAGAPDPKVTSEQPMAAKEAEALEMGFTDPDMLDPLDEGNALQDDNLDVHDMSWWERARFVVQDQMIGLKGKGTPTKAMDVYDEYDLLLSRRATNIEDFHQKYRDRMVGYFNESGLTTEELDDYLHAYHIFHDDVNKKLSERASLSFAQKLMENLPKERRKELEKAIAEAKKEFKDGKTTKKAVRQNVKTLVDEFVKYEKKTPEGLQEVSAAWADFKNHAGGMQKQGTNDKGVKVAKDVLGNEKFQNNDALNKLADLFWAMNRDILKIRREQGIDTAKQEESMAQEYPHYVTLRRAGFEHDVRGKTSGISGGANTGRVIGTRVGTENFQRPVVSAFANTLAKAEYSIRSAERNRAHKAFADIIRQNADDWRSWFTVTKEEIMPMHDDYGFTKERQTKQARPHDIVFFDKGKRLMIRPKETNERAMSTATAVNGLESPPLRGVLSIFNHVNNWMRAVNVTMSPFFLLTNTPRDFFTAQYNMRASEAENYVGKINGEYRNSMRDLGRFFITGESRKTLLPDHQGTVDPGAALIDRFRKSGGMISWVQSTKEMEEGAKDFAKLARMEKVPTAKFFNRSKNFIEATNLVMENVMRLSAFKVLTTPKDQGGAGLKDEKAARIVKDLTTNFTRRGSATTALNAYHLFFNASIQGVAQILMNAKTSPKLQKMLVGTVVFSFMVDQMNRALSDEDEDSGRKTYDQISDFVKERNMVFWNPVGEDWITIPAPWGYNAIWRAGQVLSEWAAGVPDFTAGRAATQLLDATLNSFSPIQGLSTKQLAEGDIGQFVAPTALDPLMMIWTGTSFAGTPLWPQGYPGAAQRPDAYKSWGSTSEWAKGVAEWANEKSGGYVAKSGAVDVHPAVLEIVADTVGGSLWRGAEQGLTLAGVPYMGPTAERPNQIPFYRQLFHEPEGRIDTELYHQRIAETYGANKSLQEYLRGENRDPIMARRVREEKGPELRMLQQAKDTERQIKDLRKKVRQAEAVGRDKQAEMFRKRIKVLQKRFNTSWGRKVGN